MLKVNAQFSSDEKRTIEIVNATRMCLVLITFAPFFLIHSPPLRCVYRKTESYSSNASKQQPSEAYEPLKIVISRTILTIFLFLFALISNQRKTCFFSFSSLLFQWRGKKLQRTCELVKSKSDAICVRMSLVLCTSAVLPLLCNKHCHLWINDSMQVLIEF